MYDVIVIGAGHNGLVTAAYLAKANLRVLVLERRAVVGGCAVTEEVDSVRAPGCRVSTASYIASMLSPVVIDDLKLGKYGLQMVACEPGVQAAFEDGDVVSHWSDRQRLNAELHRVAPNDVEQFFKTDAELKKLAAYLQPLFLQAPPDLTATGPRKWWELFKLGKQFRGIESEEVSGLVRLLSGSLGDFLEQRFKSDKLRRLILANSLYGKHGGPFHPGTAMGLLFHLLSGGEHRQQGFQGHVIGGMGAITQALAGANEDLSVTIRTNCEVDQVNVSGGKVQGVTLADGDVIEASTVISNADPRHTYLSLVNKEHLSGEFRESVRNIRMNGPCGKVNFVLDREPQVRGMPATHSKAERSLFTLVPTLQGAEDSYHQARQGLVPDTLWVDCVLASNVDDTLAPAGKHMLTCFVQFLPYHLASATWDEERAPLGDRVTSIIDGYAPGFAGSVVARDVITPLDLETRFGITEGNIFHGDIALDQLFLSRPLPNWARYRSPLKGLYLCGAGTHPGGGVTGAPGYNAARQIRKDLKR